MIGRRSVISGAAALAAATSLRSARAQQDSKEVRIGAIYPFTGPGAQIGVEAKYALDTAVEVINGSYDVNLLRARDKGLPNLGGAKVRIVYADHQADPQKGRAEAERLITQEGVAALTGTYYSSVAAVVSQVAERYQVPFIAAESSSPSLHRRGLKYFFRAGPHDEMFTNAMFEFIDEMAAAGTVSVKSIALFYEDTLFGT
ncbi:ABC transporter substrate-binding protein, partial [Chelatococcus sp.]|uniref:ABC transporter substrate-binding protein n=1 Tax=Chelatococcus sp. TaxID=1953771 RepID=UPI0025C6F689